MKGFAAILALFILVQPVLPVVEYVWNYDYIATKLCINKANPTLHCNGKCYLMKKLAKSSEDEKPVSEKKSTFKEINVLYFQEIAELTVPVLNRTATPVRDNYSDLYRFLVCTPAFRPPGSFAA